METLSLPKPNRIILDDGFQKLSIKRDIDIVLLDSLSPFGNGHLLPLGRLRETPKALKRADIVLKVRKESSKASSKEVDASSIFYSTILQNKDSLPTHTHVFCAIGKPKFFINFFEKNNIVIDSAVIKTDHDSFKIKDFSHLDASANLSLTLKDYLRQKEFFDELNFNLYIFDLDLDESYLANLIS